MWATNRARITGFDPELSYSADDAKDLTVLFAASGDDAGGEGEVVSVVQGGPGCYPRRAGHWSTWVDASRRPAPMASG